MGTGSRSRSIARRRFRSSRRQAARRRAPATVADERLTIGGLDAFTVTLRSHFEKQEKRERRRQLGSSLLPSSLFLGMNAAKRCFARNLSALDGTTTTSET